MIADGGTIMIFQNFNSININIGEYPLDSPMISTKMGVVDVVLGVQFLQSLALNFQVLLIIFSLEG
jgi:hypothetical protein